MSGIAKVEQKGNQVYAYSAGGSVLWTRNGRLVNFAGSTVSIQEGGTVYTYDASGTVIDRS